MDGDVLHRATQVPLLRRRLHRPRPHRRHRAPTLAPRRNLTHRRRIDPGPHRRRPPGPAMPVNSGRLPQRRLASLERRPDPSDPEPIPVDDRPLHQPPHRPFPARPAPTRRPRRRLHRPLRPWQQEGPSALAQDRARSPPRPGERSRPRHRSRTPRCQPRPPSPTTPTRHPIHRAGHLDRSPTRRLPPWRLASSAVPRAAPRRPHRAPPRRGRRPQLGRPRHRRRRRLDHPHPTSHRRPHHRSPREDENRAAAASISTPAPSTS